MVCAGDCCVTCVFESAEAARAWDGAGEMDVTWTGGKLLLAFCQQTAISDRCQWQRVAGLRSLRGLGQVAPMMHPSCQPPGPSPP
jgi:hypothetical protein